MKQLLVFCAFVATGYSLPDYRIPNYQPAPLHPDGTVADTPEVAVAKTAHYAALVKAGGAVPHYVGQWVATPGSPDYPHSGYYWYVKAPLNPDGTVAETLEVHHAKLAHFAAHAKARAYLGLPVTDTPEVAAAKATHCAAYNAARARSRSKRYAPAPLNPDGTVADTPEVAAAKVQHFAEVAKARANTLFPVSPYYTGGKWLGPPAPLNPDGTVAETPEVQALKAAHFAAHAGARHGTPVFQPTFFYGYTPLNADGTVAETPAVVARKVQHFAAYNQALARLG